MATYIYRRKGDLKEVAESEINNALARADSESNVSPFADGDVILVPDKTKLSTHEWECVDGDDNPVKDRRNNGSFLVISNGKFESGEAIEEIALSLFKTKKGFTPAADNLRPSIEGLCPFGSKPTKIWAAIKAVPASVTRGSVKFKAFVFRSIEYLGSDGRYHTLSAITKKS